MAQCLLFKNKLKEFKLYILKETVMAISISKEAMDNQGNPISMNVTGILDKIGELVWFLLSLLLFIALGPFSAPIALIALLQLGCEENDLVPPKPAA